MKQITLLAFGLAILATSCDQKSTSGQAELKNELDSVSYFIGVTYGRNLTTSGIEEFNFDVMNKGLQDGFDTTMNLDPQIIKMYLSAYFDKLDRKEAEGNEEKSLAFMDENKSKEGVQTAPEGYQYKVIEMGDGVKPGEHDTVVVHYTGTLIDGSIFDSSKERGFPATFPVDRVIQGWTSALQQMPVGSKWILYIPPSLAYGPTKGPGGNLPPSSTLIFEVELLDVIPAADAPAPTE